MKGVINLIKQELVKELTSIWFYIGIIGCMFMWYICMKHWMYSGVITAIYSIGVNNNSHLIPLFAAFPSVCCFSDEYNSGFYKYTVIRCSPRKYILSRIFAVSASSFLVSFISLFLVSIGGFFFYGTHLGNYQNSRPFAGMMEKGYEIEVMLLLVIIISVFMVIFSQYALAISAILPNKFVAISMPFICSLTLEIITLNMKLEYSIYRMKGFWYLTGQNNECYRVLTGLLAVIIYCIIANIVFTWVVKRRIRCEIN